MNPGSPAPFEALILAECPQDTIGATTGSLHILGSLISEPLRPMLLHCALVQTLHTWALTCTSGYLCSW